MILLFPQATRDFNILFEELVNESLADDFLNKAFQSYRMDDIEKVLFVILENNVVNNHLSEFLKESNFIEDFEIIELKKETSGSICTSLMAISSLKNKNVIISALDQIIIDDQLNLDKNYFNEDNQVICPIFEANDQSLSYVLRDDLGNVIQLFEKKNISNEALLGVYFIKDFSLFFKNCHELLIKYKGFKNRIFYTSDVINCYLSKNMKCNFPKINTNYVKIRSLDDFKNLK